MSSRKEDKLLLSDGDFHAFLSISSRSMTGCIEKLWKTIFSTLICILILLSLLWRDFSRNIFRSITSIFYFNKF